jgi:hypothetical protein
MIFTEIDLIDFYETLFAAIDMFTLLIIINRISFATFTDIMLAETTFVDR